MALWHLRQQALQLEHDILEHLWALHDLADLARQVVTYAQRHQIPMGHGDYQDLITELDIALQTYQAWAAADPRPPIGHSA